MYSGKVKIRVSNNGEIDIIGIDGVTFIATFGHGEIAQILAQHCVNLWNKNVDSQKT